MSVIHTNQWLMESWEQPMEMCAKLEEYFTEVSSGEIYQHLVMHGMYELPLEDGRNVITKLQEKDSWEIIHKEEQRLRKLWNGPDIPIFIFPSNLKNPVLKEDFNGKSGLAFQDKLFLFISDENTESELKALFTHEYNHICRLAAYEKKELEYTLLDTMILEGLAENAVREHCGKRDMAKWTTSYTEQELERMWQRLISPVIHLSKQHPKHQQVLYGTHFFPKMAGYSVGYFLVKKYVEENKLPSKELLAIPSNEIAGIPSGEDLDTDH